MGMLSSREDLCLLLRIAKEFYQPRKPPHSPLGMLTQLQALLHYSSASTRLISQNTGLLGGSTLRTTLLVQATPLRIPDSIFELCFFLFLLTPPPLWKSGSYLPVGSPTAFQEDNIALSSRGENLCAPLVLTEVEIMVIKATDMLTVLGVGFKI